MHKIFVRLKKSLNSEGPNSEGPKLVKKIKNFLNVFSNFASVYLRVHKLSTIYLYLIECF